MKSLVEQINESQYRIKNLKDATDIIAEVADYLYETDEDQYFDEITELRNIVEKMRSNK